MNSPVWAIVDFDALKAMTRGGNDFPPFFRPAPGLDVDGKARAGVSSFAAFCSADLRRGASLSAGDAFVAAFGRRNGNVFGQVSGKRVCGQRGATRGDAMMYRQGRWRKSRGTVRSACGRRDGPVAGRSCAEIPQNVPACGEECGGGALPGQEQHERRGSIRQMRQGGKDASVRKPAMRGRRKVWRRVSHEGRRRNEGGQEDGTRKTAQEKRRNQCGAANPLRVANVNRRGRGTGKAVRRAICAP